MLHPDSLATAYATMAVARERAAVDPQPVATVATAP
jgi:hypothetical protein